MMDQEKTMRLSIAIGTALLIAAALAVSNDTPPKTATVDTEPVAAAEQVVPATETDQKPGAVVKATPRSATITLRSTSDAGEYGTASLLDLGNNKTRITIVMVNAPKDDTQPANIHGGGCKDASKEPQYALKPVVKGRSVTELNVSMGALVDQSLQSIRVRTDAVTPGAPYAACGDLR